MALKDITIKFSAKGDDVLIRTIKNLDKATKSLIKAQSALAGEGKKKIGVDKANLNSLRKLNIELKLQGSSLKSVGLNSKLYSDALKGNKLAMAKIRVATKKYNINLKKTRKGLFETAHATRILGGSFAVLRSKMLLVSFGASLVAMTIGKLVKLAGEQEKAEIKLSTAIGKRSSALLAFASSQQKVTAFGDEEIITAMSLVGAYTNNEKAISRLTKVSMDLAVAKGMDLATATDLVAKSVFSSTNALSRYGVQIEGTQGSVQRLESATSSLSALYGGQAEADAKTFLGSMKQLSDAVGDVGENLGNVFAPIVLVSAKAMKAFAESFDEEKIKSYGTALLTVSGAFGIYTVWAHRSALATLKFGKALKLSGIGLAIAGLGFAIDKLGIFGDETSNLTEELKKLEGQLGKMNKKGSESLDLNHKLAMSALLYANSLQNLSDIESNRSVLTLELNQLREKHGVTEANFNRIMEENIEFAIAYNANRKKSVELEKSIQEAKIKTVSTFAGALSQMNQSMKGSALASKRLAQIQAVIDTYAGANKALASAPPPFNFIAMASVIAAGLANVATIEAQKFAKGGDFITDKPEIIMVGEAGRERVQITPIDRPEERALTDGGITVNIMGGIIQEDYITNELLPAINKAKALA